MIPSMPPMDTNLGTGNGPAILDHQRPPSNHPKKPPHGSQRWTTDAVDPQPDRESHFNGGGPIYMHQASIQSQVKLRG